MTAKIIKFTRLTNKKNKEKDSSSEKKESFSEHDIEIFKSILVKASKLNW